MKGKGGGFTLLELLVVMGIILILVAIATPNFLAVRTRSQVVVARAHTQAIERGLDLYSIDHRQYPPTFSSAPADPLGLFARHQLSVLTSPISYVSSGALRDPFGLIQAQIYDPSLSSDNDFPKLGQPNPEKSLLYFYYPSLTERSPVRFPLINGASIISIGPDRKDSLGAFRPFPPIFFERRTHTEAPGHPYDTVYQPTNGVRSGGDIGGYAGEARRFSVP